MDYYTILDVPRSSTEDQIKQAYRRQAIKYHPDKNPTNKEMAIKLFAQVAEAYSVLVDAQLRAKFDRSGESGLKLNKKGAPGWIMSTTPEKVFTDFFGSFNPFLSEANNTSSGSGNTATYSNVPVAPVIEVNMYCTLQELFSGCAKKVKVARQRVNDDGKGIRMEDVVMNIDVKAGWKAGTKITYPQEGNQTSPSVPPSDVIVYVREAPDPHFKRRDKSKGGKNEDVEYRTQITLKEALCGCLIEVVTLNGKTLSLHITDIVSPSYEHVIKGAGLPRASDPRKFGDLYVVFDIIFPTVLSQQQKDVVSRML